jgi:hypothetical protein
MSQDLITHHETLEAMQTPSLQDGSLAGAIARVEIDTLIATARQYPRSIAVAIKRMCDLATIDEQASEECVYSLPRGGKTLEGPSIRFAELAAQSWSNSRVAARTTVIDKKEKFVEAEGFFLDAETNVATVARIRRRISTSNGKLFNDDMILVTCNAAQSIARRNAILAGIPKAVWRKPYEMARHVIMGDLTTLANRRADAIKAFQRFGITEAQVLGLLQVKGVEDIDQEKLVPLRGMYSSLHNQEITVEELLRSIEPEKAERAPVSATITAPAAFADTVPSATPTAAAAAPAEVNTTVTTEAAAAVLASAQPAAAAQPVLFDQETGELPDDEVIVANDIIARIRAAGGNAEALKRIVDEAQQEFNTLPEAQRTRVNAVYAEASKTKRKVA